MLPHLKFKEVIGWGGGCLACPTKNFAGVKKHIFFFFLGGDGFRTRRNIFLQVLRLGGVLFNFHGVETCGFPRYLEDHPRTSK